MITILRPTLILDPHEDENGPDASFSTFSNGNGSAVRLRNAASTSDILGPAGNYYLSVLVLV